MGSMNNIASALNPMSNSSGQVMPGQMAQNPTAMNPVAMALLQRLGPAIAAQKMRTVGDGSQGQIPATPAPAA